MSPESACQLKVIDLYFGENGRLYGDVDTVVLKYSRLRDIHVQWYVGRKRPDSHFSVGNGVAYIKGEPAGESKNTKKYIYHKKAGHPITLYQSTDESKPVSERVGKYSYFWNDVVADCDDKRLMLVLILPKNFTIDFAKTDPLPKADVKVFDESRLALFWFLSGNQDAETHLQWALKDFHAAPDSLQNEAQRMNSYLMELAPHNFNLEKLREEIGKRFNTEELKDLCIDLGIDYEDLGGEGRKNKIRELVYHHERRDTTPKLVERVRVARPGIRLQDIQNNA